MKAWFARLSDAQVADIITNDQVPVLHEDGIAPMPALEEVALAVEGQSIVFLPKELSFLSQGVIQEAGRSPYAGDNLRDPVAATAEGQG